MKKRPSAAEHFLQKRPAAAIDEDEDTIADKQNDGIQSVGQLNFN